MFSPRRVFNFDLKWQADQLTKRLPLQVVVWSSKFSLLGPSNIELFISQQPGTEQIVRYPVYLTNVGEGAIQGLDIAIDGASNVEGFNFSIFPPEAFPLLNRGQSVFPPKVIEVRVDKAKSQSIQKTLTVYGTAEGRRLPLKSINVFVHASSPNCLQVLGSKTLEFRSISPAGVEARRPPGARVGRAPRRSERSWAGRDFHRRQLQPALRRPGLRQEGSADPRRGGARTRLDV